MLAGFLQTACLVCGATFKAKRRHARYCSSLCRTRAHRARKPKKTKDERATQRAARQAARRAAREARWMPCGTRAAYEQHLSRGEQPCDSCRQAERDRRRNRRPYGAKAGACSQCGKAVWLSRSSRPDPTCHDCRRGNPGAAKASPYKRRLLSNVPWDGVTNEEILERDRWLCRMDQCLFGSRRIYKSRKWPDPRSPSIDHIIPLSFGGDDTQFNKRAAHLRCNIVRGTAPDSQMPLNFSAQVGQ